MLNIFRRSLATGIVTTRYPDGADPMPAGARGTPELLPDRCRGHAACAAVCPSGAIAVTPTPPPQDSVPPRDAARTWQIDYGRCLFCGLCAEACPEQAIAITGRYELAARRREDLVVRVSLGGGSAASPVGSAAVTPPSPPASVGGASASSGTTDLRATPDAAGSPHDDSLAERLERTIRRAFRRSLHVRHLDAGSDNATDWELTTLLGPVYDVQRLGIDFVASPRHADVLAVTGPVTRALELAVRRTYEATPDPKLVLAIGSAACGGDIVPGGYATAGGVDRVIPVDIFIPGDPPRPQAIIYGFLLALGRR